MASENIRHEKKSGAMASSHAMTSSIRELKIYNAAARRRAFKTMNIFIEDNNYEQFIVPEVFSTV